MKTRNMKRIIFLLLGLCTVLLTSCIEIIDDLTINSDGSGSFKYHVNLSSSKVKVNSILALDTLGGKKVPTKIEIEQLINEFKNQLSKEAGLTNVQTEVDLNNFIVKISCDFKTVNQLQSGIKNTIQTLYKTKDSEMDNYTWIKWEDQTLYRSIPQIAPQELKRLKSEEREQLKNGTYTSFTRFDKEIAEFDNTKGQLSKNKKAIMLRIDPNSLLSNTGLLTNRIKLEP